MTVRRAWIGLAALLAANACNKIYFKAADQATRYKTEAKVSTTVEPPPGFRAVVVAEGLNYPSSITWDAAGRMYVLESGTVPIPTLSAKILRAGASGRLEEVQLTGGFPGPEAVGIVFHDCWLYFSHEEKGGTWGVSRARPEGGAVETVVRGIPSRADHWINYLVFDRAGTLWFGVGSATNSGVVSSHDPVNAKWIKKRPDAHDVPCRDLVLTGATFSEEDALAPAKGTRATTGAYQPYRRSEETRIPGQVPCTGALFRQAPGGTPQLAAWGFRNPVALAFDAAGALFIGMQGADIRGTRPILDDPDAIYRLREGAWYGWPDYSADLKPVTDPAYCPPQRFLAEGKSTLEFVIDHEKSGLSAPDRSLLVAATEPHAALGGMTFVPPGGAFTRWAGQLLLSEMGDFKPSTDPLHPDLRAGFQIESVEPKSGRRAVFARNRGGALPSSQLDRKDGFERPVVSTSWTSAPSRPPRNRQRSFRRRERSFASSLPRPVPRLFARRPARDRALRPGRSGSAPAALAPPAVREEVLVTRRAAPKRGPTRRGHCLDARGDRRLPAEAASPVALLLLPQPAARRFP